MRKGILGDNLCCATMKTGETNTAMHEGRCHLRCTLTGETLGSYRRFEKCETEDQESKINNWITQCYWNRSSERKGTL